MIYCQKLRVTKVKCQILECHKQSGQKLEWQKQSFPISGPTYCSILSLKVFVLQVELLSEVMNDCTTSQWTTYHQCESLSQMIEISSLYINEL